MRTTLMLLLILSVGIYVNTIDFNSADAVRTGSYNFCTQFPAFPECSGYRTESIIGNYWFCIYVDLKGLCDNVPSHEKKLPLRSESYCCKYIGPKLTKISLEDGSPESQLDRVNLPIEKAESILPLIIWTDRDHYNFGDKTIVYGKFDFTNPSIIQNIEEKEFAQTGEVSEKTFTVDIKLNGRDIIRNIPVNSNGWFSTFFYNNNVYTFSTQSNLLDVEYVITQGVIPAGGPKTHATYQFTTGDVAEKDESFEMWLDESSLPHKIRYGVKVENPERFLELDRHGLVSTRLTTPDGFVLPLDSNFSIQDLSTEYSEFTGYGHGKYEIQITYGDNTSKTTFEYNP